MVAGAVLLLINNGDLFLAGIGALDNWRDGVWYDAHGWG